jgi:hypothetical protein
MFNAERVPRSATGGIIPRPPAHARGDLEFPTLPLLCALRAAAGGQQRRGFSPSNLPQYAPRPPRHARSDHAIPTPALLYAMTTRRTR